MYVEERQFRSPPAETPWENAIILEGNKIFTLTGLKAGVAYILRWQAPDRQFPDVKVATKGTGVLLFVWESAWEREELFAEDAFA